MDCNPPGFSVHGVFQARVSKVRKAHNTTVIINFYRNNENCINLPLVYQRWHVVASMEMCHSDPSSRKDLPPCSGAKGMISRWPSAVSTFRVCLSFGSCPAHGCHILSEGGRSTKGRVRQSILQGWLQTSLSHHLLSANRTAVQINSHNQHEQNCYLRPLPAPKTSNLVYQSKFLLLLPKMIFFELQVTNQVPFQWWSSICLPNIFSSLQSLSCVQLLVTPWTAASQASLSITNSRSLLKLMSMMSWVSDAIQPSHPLSPPSLPTFNLSQHRVFSNESALHIRWPKYWSFSFNISPSNEYSGLI